MLWAVIMAGGAGTRFWPESREKTPKQFLPLFGRHGKAGRASPQAGKKTLFEETLHRIAPIIPKSRVIVVTQSRYESQVRKLGRIPASHIIGEPVGRNTAPCVALAAALIQKKDPNAVLAILPSDHQIGKPALFRKILKAAAAAAHQHRLPVTFGMKATFPHTGYGYLEREKLLEKRNGVPVYRLKQFHEKPALAKAKAFLKTGRFLWNSGMFIWRADHLLEATQQHLPKVSQVLSMIVSSPRTRGSSMPLTSMDSRFRGNDKRKLSKLYPLMPSISIDFGLMERMRGKVLTIPADIEWCDLGGWLAFHDLGPRDGQGNVIQGDQVLSVESRGNFVRTGKKLTALVGVQDLVVVETGDALLIASKDKVESVKKIVEMLRERRWTQYL